MKTLVFIILVSTVVSVCLSKESRVFTQSLINYSDFFFTLSTFTEQRHFVAGNTAGVGAEFMLDSKVYYYNEDKDITDPVYSPLEDQTQYDRPNRPPVDLKRVPVRTVLLNQELAYQFNHSNPLSAEYMLSGVKVKSFITCSSTFKTMGFIDESKTSPNKNAEQQYTVTQTVETKPWDDYKKYERELKTDYNIDNWSIDVLTNSKQGYSSWFLHPTVVHTGNSKLLTNNQVVDENIFGLFTTFKIPDEEIRACEGHHILTTEIKPQFESIEKETTPQVFKSYILLNPKQQPMYQRNMFS